MRDKAKMSKSVPFYGKKQGFAGKIGVNLKDFPMESDHIIKNPYK